MIEHPMAILSVFFVILAVVFNFAAHPKTAKYFKYVPPIIFAYFVPTILTTIGVLPASSPLYSWVKTFLLPVALFLFTMSLDLPTLMKLGPKAIGMMLVGTVGIVIGGPISLFLFKAWLPPDAWQGMAAISGSWIGGTANFVAMGQAVGATDSIMGPMIIVDTVVGLSWMGLLLYFIGRKEQFNRWVKADRSSIDAVQHKMADFQASVERVATLPDLLLLLGLAFSLTWIAYWLGNRLPPVGDFISGSTWRVILITTFGVMLSFTKVSCNG